MKYKIGDRVLVTINGQTVEGKITKVFNKACNVCTEIGNYSVRNKHIKKA